MGPIVCIALSLLFLKKPCDILRESMADLVEANAYGEAVDTLEECAKAVAERFHLRGVEWVRVRKAGCRIFVMVSFFEDAPGSLEDVDRVRQAVIDELARLNPDVDVVAACRLAPAPADAPDPGASTVAAS